MMTKVGHDGLAIRKSSKNLNLKKTYKIIKVHKKQKGAVEGVMKAKKYLV